MRRESICRPVTPSAHGRAIRRPSGSTTSSSSGIRLLQHLARDGPVVEGNEPAVDLHLGVGALAGDHDDVAVTRRRERLLDRCAAVDDDLELARRDLVGDRLRILAARVVGRDDRAVGARRGDTAHQRALVAVPVAAGAEHDGQPARAELSRRAQHIVERVGGVRVVDDHAERLPCLDRLEAAGDARDGLEAAPDRIRVDSERARRGDCARGVLSVEAAAQAQGGAELVVARRSRSRRAARLPAAAPTRRRGSRPRRRPGRRARVSQRSTSSIVPWKSRWSCVRFVKTSTRKRVPARRPCALPIDVASIAHERSPASSISRSRRWRSIASGVFRPIGRSSPPTTRRMFVSSAGPAAGRLEDRVQQERGRRLAVRAGDGGDLELSDGRPKNSAAAGPIASRTLGTTSCGTSRSSRRSTTSATAPRSTACAARSWPSTVRPGMQKKSAPGVTARVS